MIVGEQWPGVNFSFPAKMFWVSKKTCQKSTELLVQTHGIYPGISQRGGNWFQVNFESFYGVVFLSFKPCVLISLQAWKWCFKKPTETLQIVFLPTKKHYRRVVNLSRECFCVFESWSFPWDSFFIKNDLVVTAQRQIQVANEATVGCYAFAYCCRCLIQDYRTIDVVSYILVNFQDFLANFAWIKRRIRHNISQVI